MGFRTWLEIDGDTPRERVRNGFPQLVVVCVLVWLGALVTWNVLSAVIGPAAAVIVVLVAGLYVGLDLRDRMIGPVEVAVEDHHSGESGSDGTKAE